MSAGPWFTALAPAKINLFLEVLARRPDGYHELETLMLAVDLCDRLRARRVDAPGVRLSVSGPQASSDLPLDGRNLAVRAALSALELAQRAGALGEALGIELELEKHIPSQAGLGGASSDAAAAFALVESMLEWKCEELAAQSALAALGSDCAFFRTAGRTGFARCTGRGELVEPLAPRRDLVALLLVTPDVGAPTPLVYRSLADPLCWRDDLRSLAARFNPGTSLAAAPAESGASADPFAPFNRLEDAACSAIQRLAAWREFLKRHAPARFCLSGSGSSFFALFDTPAKADAELRRLLEAGRNAGFAPRGAWVVRPFRHLGR